MFKAKMFPSECSLLYPHRILSFMTQFRNRAPAAASKAFATAATQTEREDSIGIRDDRMVRQRTNVGQMAQNTQGITNEQERGLTHGQIQQGVVTR